MSRFDELKGRLAHKPGVRDPAALAAKIGRDKLGAKTFNAQAKAGRRKKPREALVREYLKRNP